MSTAQTLLVVNDCLVTTNYRRAVEILAAIGLQHPLQVTVRAKGGGMTFDNGVILTHGDPCVNSADAPEQPPAFSIPGHDPRDTATRLAICAVCPALSAGICTKAACKCEVAATAAVPWAECPENRWPVVTVEPQRTVAVPPREEDKI